MTALGVTASDVRTALRENNILSAVGTTKGSMVEVNLKAATENRAPDWNHLGMLAGIELAFFLVGSGFLFYLWLNLPVDFSLRDTAYRMWMRLPIISKASMRRSLAGRGLSSSWSRTQR